MASVRRIIPRIAEFETEFWVVDATSLNTLAISPGRRANREPGDWLA